MIPTAFRRPIPAMLLALALLTAAGAADARSKAAPKAPQGFIEHSRVYYPERLDPLRDGRGAPAGDDVSAGVALRYWIGGERSVYLDLFVYPAGRMRAEEALDRGAADLVQSLHEAAKHGLYADLEVDPPSAFPLAAVTPPESAGEHPPPEAPSGDESAPHPTAAPTDPAPAEPLPDYRKEIVARLAALKSAPLPGRRVPLRYTDRGAAVRSLAYLFYKNLYFFKVRISLPVAESSQEHFDEIADTAVRVLVPAVSVQNIGACAEMNVTVDPSASREERQKQIEFGILAVLERQLGDGCVGSFKPPKELPGTQSIDLDFPADAWTSKARH